MGGRDQKVKLDQIKELFNKKEFRQAFSLCEEVDWSRIKSVQSLFMASDVYKSVGNWEEALTCLEYAYDRAPVGKYILYQLADLALSVGQKSRAGEYVEEYQQIAPQDSNLLLLNYRLRKLNGDTPDKLIPILKQYLAENLDEQWSYELAELYAQNMQLDECIEQCDYIILWFSVGEYVDKALALKGHYVPLSEEEIEKRDNKERYRMRLKQVELEFRSPEDIQVLTNRKEREKEEERLAAKGILESKVKLPEDFVPVQEHEKKKETREEKDPSLFNEKVAAPPPTQEEMRERFEQIKTMIRQERVMNPRKRTKVAQMNEADESEESSKEEELVKRDSLSDETMDAQGEALPQSVREYSKSEESKEMGKEEKKDGQPKGTIAGEMSGIKLDGQEERTPLEGDKKINPSEDVEDGLVLTKEGDLIWHFAIRCINPDKGFAYAQKRMSELKKGHEQSYPEQMLQVRGMELNLNDLLETRVELRDKTVVVEYIGELADERVKELMPFLAEETHTQFIFLDYPERLERFLRRYPDLTAQLHHVEDMEVYDVDSLLDYAKKYASDRDYTFHVNAIPVLDQTIKRILLEENEDPVEMLEQFLDEVIERSEEKTVMQMLRNVLFVRYDEENRLILKKEDLLKVVREES